MAVELLGLADVVGDDEDGSTVVQASNPNGAARSHTLASTTGRYLRLWVTRLGGPASDESTRYRPQLAETRIK
ncbi:hypothetical protein [Streptomyces caeruleatus]|uniref:hypothetical protein n=1 Tax=Streptomyces caeruleatus TaxID=661399 RepID=UPI001ABF9765|nr:hypothetical protein [Streptomyces caeruleatus]